MLSHPFMRHAFLAGTADRRRARARRLLRRAAQPGVQRRRAQPRRVHRRARRARVRRRRRASASSSRPSPSALALGAARRPRPRRRRRHRHRLRLDPRPRRALPRHLHDHRAARRTAPPASTSCSARSSGSAPAQADRRRLDRSSASVVAVLAIARPLLFASLDEAVAAARGVPVRRSASASSASSASAPPKRPRRSARCCSSGCSPRRPARRSASPTDPTCAFWLVRRASRSSDVDRAHHQLPRADVPPSFAIIAVATAVYLAAFVVGRRFDDASNTADLSVSGDWVDAPPTCTVTVAEDTWGSSSVRAPQQRRSVPTRTSARSPSAVPGNVRLVSSGTRSPRTHAERQLWRGRHLALGQSGERTSSPLPALVGPEGLRRPSFCADVICMRPTEQLPSKQSRLLNSVRVMRSPDGPPRLRVVGDVRRHGRRQPRSA